jgi:tartrate dehydrogenase/decarboxylase / D-malate dehydrogenase
MTDARQLRIAVVAGDGIGQEVVPEGVRVLDAIASGSAGRVAFDYEHFPWGCQYYLETGRMLDPDALERLKTFDAIYFGAVGWPGVPDHVSLWGLRLAICQGFDQYANIRPVRLLPGVPSPLKNATAETMDWVVVRENSEGEYAGIGGRNFSARGVGKEIALQAGLFSAEGCERIMRYAFDMALGRKRQKVTSVTKSNAQQFGMTLWDEVFARVALDYPGVETEQWLVDAMAARFVLKPETLEVVVASNLFADILSDLGSALAGSMGIAASANINPEGRYPSMFEPVHGSAPDIAGQGIANPIGAIWAGAMLLDTLGESAAAGRVMRALEDTTREGRYLTRDVGGSATTREVGQAVAARVLAL